MWNRRHLLRDFEAGRQLDLMLVAAISAVLGIRFYLAATGYPEVGGDSLHIAHMLWGGLLMLVALVLLLSFVGRGPHRLAALAGGLGFGTFIDEVGKFVTHDHDYFYQPAVSIIYVVFVLLYLAIRSIHRERAAAPAEYLANALQEMQQIATDDLGPGERERAIRYLERYGAARPPAPALRAVLQDATVVPAGQRGWPTRTARTLRLAYRRLVTSRWFRRGLIAFFLLQFVTRLMRVAAQFSTLPRLGDQLLQVPLVNPVPVMGHESLPLRWLLIGSNLLAGVFIVLGVVSVMRGYLLPALRRFQRAVLVTLVLSQVFVFYRVEWLGLLEFAFHLLVFFALQFMIERETARS